MKLQLIDLLMILAYIVVIIAIGIVQKKRAQKSKKNYLLGGNQLPWYMLGLSNASGMFDISGTMWLVTLTFIYGMKSIWIPWLWPVFNQIFLMVFLSIWLRRSGVTTGAEWIQTRFGTGQGSKLSHTIVVIFALVSGLGFLAYGFIGLGKFVEIFIPWSVVSPYVPFSVPAEYVPHFYGVLFTLIATFYSILGGMLSIVWADVIQYTIMTIASVIIAVIAMNALGDAPLAVPAGWNSPFFGWELNLDWTELIASVNDKIANDGYSLFSVFMMMLLFKGILVSAAGPAPNYDMQKILATKSPSEAAKMSGSVSMILMPARYLMIAGFAVLGLVYFRDLNLAGAGGSVDFEKILPEVMSGYLPAGLLGLLLVGLMAAFMSTFAGTLNAAQAYIVNDLYIRYINPEAKGKKVSVISYIVGVSTVTVSIVIGFFVRDINSVLNWIVAGLWGGYVAPNVLKWYWWRLNGHGYFWGMVAGIVPALVATKIIPNNEMVYWFPVLLLLSLIGTILGTLMSKPTDEETLMTFYRKVRPWGFWKPIHDKVSEKYLDFERNKDFKRDMINIAVGIVWQTSLVALPIYFVIKEFVPAAVTLGIAVITTYILKKNWWDKLAD